MIKRIVCIMLMAASVNAAFSQNDDKANILAVERNAADAFSKHSIATLLSIFTDDATIITPSGELITKQQLQQRAQPINGLTLSDMQVKVKGVFAVVTGIQTETGKDASGMAYTTKSHFTDVLERKNGGWFITASQATPVQ
ncbi:YybH family protein [Parafilimonas sp.]|uniref:YybH family protein n=1 Tax=Parafilimonas sp. TaxID=1969739 RepID=UPI0039E719C1